MLVTRPLWVFGIVLAISYAYALDPPNISPRPPNTSLPPYPILDPRSSVLNIKITNYINSTSTGCVAAVGLKISKFFLFNYIGHAFTVKPGAGYKTTYMITFAVAAIFLPYYGLLLACRGMETCSIRMGHSLKRAGRGGALCVVARTKKWRPRPGDKAWCWRTAPMTPNSGDELPLETVKYQGLELEYLSQNHVQIHGICRLPPGGEYMLARLPTDYDVDWDKVEMKVEGIEVPELRDEDGSISSNYSLTRPMIALVQLLSAIPVIYQAHSKESRESHGYAGYQLTVIPFALMSIINTFQTMVTPSYGASYMVRSDVMDEAELRGGVFQGVVGRAFESTKKITLAPSVKDYGEIIGEIGTFVTEEQNQNPKVGISTSRTTGDSHIQPTPSGPEGIVEEMEGFSASTSDDITEQPPVAATGGGTPRKNTENDRLWVEFQDTGSDTDPKIRYLYPGLGVEQRKRPLFYATRKAMHFILRQQVWESFREEFPIVRWFLKPHDLTRMPRNEIPGLENEAYKKKEKGEQKIETPMSEPSNNNEPQSKDEIRNLLKIVRVNPQRTCITRIFKRASEKKIKGRGMILVPAIGHLRTRGKYKREVLMYYFTDILFVLSIAAPYLITFALTGYHKGGSTMFQRVIVVLWLVMMQVACIPQRIVWNFVQTRLVPLGPDMLDRGIYFIIVAGVLWSVPGIIGFVNVLHMMVNDNKDTCNGAFAHLVDISGFGTGVE